MNAGDTFVVPDAFGKHLNIVVAVLTDGSIIHCHITTLYPRSEKTCVIKKGEHPFVKHESVVRYGAIQHCTAGEALEALERCIEKRFEPVSEELLNRVREGALNSPQTSDIIKHLLR